MIARMLIGLGIKTYLVSGTVMHYVKNKKTTLQQSIKKYRGEEVQMQAVKKNNTQPAMAQI